MRFYLSQFIDRGPNWGGMDTSAHYVAVIDDLQSSSWAFIEGRLDYTSIIQWCLVWTDNSDAEHAALLADSRIKYIPWEDNAGDPLPVNAPLSQVDTVKLNNIKSFVEDHHIPTDGLTLNNTVKEAMRLIQRRFQLRQMLRADDFSETLDLTVGDIPSAKRGRIVDKLTARGFDFSGINNATTIRQALKTLVAQNGY